MRNTTSGTHELGKCGIYILFSGIPDDLNSFFRLVSLIKAYSSKHTFKVKSMGIPIGLP